MGRWAKFKKAYNHDWENLSICKGWLQERGELAHCTYCKQDLRPQLADLKKHALVQKHIKQSKSRNSSSNTVLKLFTSTKLSDSQEKKKFELQIALYIAVKSSFSSVGDLNHIIQNKFGNDAMKMHRTKCTALVKNVLAPHFKAELQEEIKDTPYSILVDESTDISSTKLIAFSIKFFSKKTKSVISTYLGSSEITKADAVGIYAAVTTTLDEWNLKGEHMVGVGTDGAACMVGEHNSLQALLRRKWPHIVHIRCVCHALDLAARDAVRKALPSNIEYMVRVTHNWFAHSSQRISAYREIAQLIGFSNNPEHIENPTDSEDSLDSSSSHPLKLISPSETRWLVIADCVERVLTQYDALTAHFAVAYEKESCYEAGTLHNMFRDDRNRLFMLFLYPVLKELRRITKMFQSNSGDNIKVYSELEQFFLALANQILKPAILRNKSSEELCSLNIESNFCILPIDSVDFGGTFLQKLENSKLSVEAKNEILKKAAGFLKELFMGMQKRMSGTFQLMKNVYKFAMPGFLEKKLEKVDLIAPYFPQDDLSMAEIDAKFRLLKTKSWSSKNTDEFWIEVHSFQDVSGNFPFQILSNGVIKMLCLPTSNAEIERVFSQVNVIKTQKRANMQTDVLNAILYCKFGLSKYGITTDKFIPSNKLLNYDSSIY